MTRAASLTRLAPPTANQALKKVHHHDPTHSSRRRHVVRHLRGGGQSGRSERPLRDGASLVVQLFRQSSLARFLLLPELSSTDGPGCTAHSSYAANLVVGCESELDVPDPSPVRSQRQFTWRRPQRIFPADSDMA